MEFNPIEHIRELMHAEGINFLQLDSSLSNLEKFDCELRKQLYPDYNYAGIRDQLVKYCQPQTLYILTDTFEMRYILFWDTSGSKDNDSTFILIGPYLTHPRDVVLPIVIERNQLPALQVSELKKFYSGVPCLLDFNSSVLESQLVVLVKYVVETTKFQVVRRDFELDTNGAETELQTQNTDRLSLAMIEERYRNEDGLLEAVERGDIQNAMLHMSAFRKYHFELRNTDIIRNYKNFFIVLNTLLRKAVQRADVHPIYIDKLSGHFFSTIEAIRTVEELNQISPEMIRQYCRLVQKQSLRNYSKPIQRVINYVDLHLADQLSLQILAEIVAVNPSYLSTQFKKETGNNLTGHINQKRIQKSIFLLNSTELPIHIIGSVNSFV